MGTKLRSFSQLEIQLHYFCSRENFYHVFFYGRNFDNDMTLYYLRFTWAFHNVKSCTVRPTFSTFFHVTWSANFDPLGWPVSGEQYPFFSSLLPSKDQYEWSNVKLFVSLFSGLVIVVELPFISMIRLAFRPISLEVKKNWMSTIDFNDKSEVGACH